jgi:hypothetical protein
MLQSWHGFFHKVDYAQGLLHRGYIYYNRTELRIFVSYESGGGEPSQYGNWRFFKERKEYEFDATTRICTVKDIPFGEEFPTYGAPTEAKFIHHDRLGSYNYNLGVTTDYFRMDTESGGVFHGYYAPLYDDGECVPVLISYEDIDTAPSDLRNTHVIFMNITTTPIPSTTWILPSECPPPPPK